MAVRAYAYGMNLSLEQNSPECPLEQPVGVVDLDSLRIRGCFKTLEEAAKARALWEDAAGQVPEDPDADKFSCSERVPVSFSTSPTISW